MKHNQSADLVALRCQLYDYQHSSNNVVRSWQT